MRRAGNLGAFAALILLHLGCSGSPESPAATHGAGAAGGAATSSSLTAPGGGGAGGATASTGSTTSASGPVDPWAGPVEALRAIDLGDVPLLKNKFFPIPENTLGFTVLVEAPSLDKLIGVGVLAPFGGGSVISNYANTGHATQLFVNDGWVAAAEPQSDSKYALPVQSGKWLLVIGDDDSSIPSGHVTVWARRTADGAFHGGVVDVNVFIAPGAASQGAVTSVLQEVFTGYAGLQLGNVSFQSLPSSAQVIDDQAEYRQIVASTASIGHSPALNLFVVQAFSSTFTIGGNQVIGMAAGIPGSPMRPGTTLSGLAYAPSGDGAFDASVLKHELGHLTGLFHTTEFAIVETDPLSDTPECPTATVMSDPMSCPDVSNVMFPIAYGATTLSPAQERVIQGCGLYRGILEDGGTPVDPLPLPPAPPPAPGAEVPATMAPGVALPPTRAERSGRARPTSPDALDRILGAVWCPHGGADYDALAIRAAGDPVRLLAKARDPRLPGLMRARALGALARTRPDLALPLARSAALDEREDSPLRVAALRALARAEAPTGRDVLARALGSSDIVVAASARELGHR